MFDSSEQVGGCGKCRPCHSLLCSRNTVGGYNSSQAVASGLEISTLIAEQSSLRFRINVFQIAIGKWLISRVKVTLV